MIFKVTSKGKWIATLFTLGVPYTLNAQPVDQDWQTLADAQLLFCFQGKGSSLPYDGGVAREAFERIDALRNKRFILAGNSSGSILAIYFSRLGFTESSLQHCERRMLQADDGAIQKMEDPARLTTTLLRDEPSEASHVILKEFIAFALGVRGWRNAQSLEEIIRQSSAKLRYPVVIVAANKEVLDNRMDGRVIAGLNYKEFDPTNFSVYWKKDVYDFYQKNPEQFAADHPDLRFGNTPYIGKAVTLFVDSTMFELLQRVPPEDRLGDLRLMTTPRDMATAILASVSEPTYFDPIEDPSPQKILSNGALGDLGVSRRRIYCGGYFVTLPAQDVRRMLPGIRVLGTGRVRRSVAARRLLQSWYLVDPEPVSHLNEWWVDMEIVPSLQVQRKQLSAKGEFDAGRAAAIEAFDTDEALPSFVLPPVLDYPAERALFSDDPSSSPSRRPLKTLRGLGHLIRSLEASAK